VSGAHHCRREINGAFFACLRLVAGALITEVSQPSGKGEPGVCAPRLGAAAVRRLLISCQRSGAMDALERDQVIRNAGDDKHIS